MTNYADLETLRKNVYFATATHDHRFVWEKIDPADYSGGDISITLHPGNRVEWTDGLDRYRIVGCAHPEAYRDGALCTHCGGEV